MWFEYPDRVDSITVERQPFAVEATAPDGRKFGRIPDHFGPLVLNMGLGFKASNPPEGTDLPDLPQADPLRDGAIAQQTQEISALRETMEQLRIELGSVSAERAALLHERDELKVENMDLKGRLEEANEKIVELEDAVPMKVKK